MSRRSVRAGFLGAILTVSLAACGGGAASSAPAASSAAPPASSAAASVCTATDDAGTVAVSIKGFAFAPADITAKVGDVITFTNQDSAGHTASPTGGVCDGTKTIPSGSSKGLVFTVAGSYPFICNIHSSMTGTITIS